MASHFTANLISTKDNSTPGLSCVQCKSPISNRVIRVRPMEHIPVTLGGDICLNQSCAVVHYLKNKDRLWETLKGDIK